MLDNIRFNIFSKPDFLYQKFRSIDAGYLTMMVFISSLDDNPEMLLFLKKNYSNEIKMIVEKLKNRKDLIHNKYSNFGELATHIGFMNAY